MIKAVITDVDGVMVGRELGVNYPLPSSAVIRELKEIQNRGISIVLATAKYHFAIHEIIRLADLDNPHITDGGALIIDLLNNKVVKRHIFDKGLAQDIADQFVKENIYLEVYTVDDYFVGSSQVSELTKKRNELLQKDSKIVDSFTEIADTGEIIKFIAFVMDEEGREKVEVLLRDNKSNINLLWSAHPALAYQLAIITVHGVSKRHAALEVLKYLKVKPAETLGIGDTLGDWDFMELCGYTAVVGNNSDELINLAKSRGAGKYFFAPSVDEDGLLTVFDHFKL